MSSASLAQSLRCISWGGTSWAAKSMTAGLPPTPTPSLCALNWSSNQIAVREKKKKNGMSGQRSLCSKTRPKHLKKLAATLLFLPLEHAGWRREDGGRPCYCAREKGNPTLPEETSPKYKPRFKPFFATLLGHIYKRWIPSHHFHLFHRYSTQHDAIPHWIQAMKTAYHSTKLGPHLIKWSLFIIQTLEKLRILTHLNSPWQRLTMGMSRPPLPLHKFLLSFLPLRSHYDWTLPGIQNICVWSAFLQAWPQKSQWPKRSLFHKSRMGVAVQVQNTTNVTAFFSVNWKNVKLKNCVPIFISIRRKSFWLPGYFCVMEPIGACSSSVTSHHATVTNMMHQDTAVPWHHIRNKVFSG